MKQLELKILENNEVAPGFYKMHIQSQYLAKNTQPGQFFEVKCSETNNPLLRRPLGVHRILKNGIEILYEVAGRGTKLLSQKKASEYLNIIGPLGNGFNVSSVKRQVSSIPILVAGGIGVAPLLALAESLAYSVERIAHRKKTEMHVLIGACKKEHVLCVNDFKKLGCEVMVSTEDGSLGKKGLITECLTSLLSTLNPKFSTIYACGPTVMLKAVAKIAEMHRMECQVSLEERMACGIGVCLGCPVKVKPNPEPRTPNAGYKMVCKDGPVFNAREIAW